MRTTLTIDDDVAAVLERLRKSRDASLKDLVNEGLRRGLREMAARPKSREPFRTRSVSLGRARMAGVDNVGEALAHAEVLGAFLALPGVHANLVPDAHLAALAMEHGLMLCSTDGDFARFPGLSWSNPIAPEPAKT